MLWHYRTRKAIRSRNGLIISNEQCWSRGFAHCSTPRRTDGLAALSIVEQLADREHDAHDITQIRQHGDYRVGDYRVIEIDALGNHAPREAVEVDGAIAIGASPAAAQEHNQNQNPNAEGPTLTVSSPECETVALDRDDRGPTTEVTVSGPTSFTTELGRGETLTREVDAGTYTISSSPRAVVTAPADGEIEVEQCYPPSVSARLDCDRDPPFRIYNRLERDIYVKMVTYFNSGVTRYEDDIIEPSRWEWYPTPRPDGWVEKYEWAIFEMPDAESDES